MRDSGCLFEIPHVLEHLFPLFEIAGVSLAPALYQPRTGRPEVLT
jgi:hypothetical protein